MLPQNPVGASEGEAQPPRLPAPAPEGPVKPGLGRSLTVPPGISQASVSKQNARARVISGAAPEVLTQQRPESLLSNVLQVCRAHRSAAPPGGPRVTS